MAAIDQRRQLDPGGAAERTDRVHRGPHRAAGEEDVIHDDDCFSFERQRQRRSLDPRQITPDPDVVPMHRDVDRAGPDLALT